MPRRTRRDRFDVVFYVPWIAALLAPGRDLPRGGAETQIHLLATELARRGWRVCAVAYQTPEGLPERAGDIHVAPRAPLRTTRVRGPLGQAWEIATTWHLVRRLDAPVFVQRGTGIDTGIVGAAVRARRRRFVYSSANTIDFDYAKVDRRRTVALFHFGVRIASAIVVQTREQVEMCRERFARTPFHIPSIAEPADTRSGTPEAFLWVGKLASYKGPLRYVDLARAMPDATFWMVGVPSEKDSAEFAREVERAAEELPNLHLLAPRPRRDLLELYDRAVAVVSTSDYEGMPNVFLEGWARGVPALAFSHDPDDVIATDDLGGVAGGSSARLAELAQQLWTQRHDSAALTDSCRAYVEREHSARAVADRWEVALGLTRPRSEGLPAKATVKNAGG